MKKLTAALLLASAAPLSFAAHAQEGPWEVRVRAVYIDPADKSDANVAAGLPSDAIHVSNKTIPELDLTYFFSPNIATELSLTYPQKHTVSVDGAGDIGHFKQMPLTLTVQYHFMPGQKARPYVGAGVNYTRISSVDLGGPTLDKNSWGGAIQAGVDIELQKNMLLNFDVKKMQVRTDASQAGVKLSELKIDPWTFGVGLGWRF